MARRSRPSPETLALLALSLFAGVVLLTVARDLFPLLSENHDEGVYLQQAAMLLEGKLWLTTDHPGAFRPWFFVVDGGRLYPKYSPVTAALFAPGVALGVPRVGPVLVGTGIVALTGLLAREAFDPPVGVLASAMVLATPFFLLITPNYLPYAPTHLLNLAFALGYVRALRRLDAGRTRASLAYALLAGVSVGLAFFARPYTAVLFGLPFVGHALLLVGRDVRTGEVTPRVTRLAVVALLGLAGVALALAYNVVVTGHALLFPYQAFAPLDGLGFGRRELLGYSRNYTPALAVRVAGQLLWELATRWTVAAPLGTLLAFVGLRSLRSDGGGTETLPDRTLRRLLAGVALSVVVGNVAFWGSLNVLGNVSDPTDGFMGAFGPFYHYDLLLPLSVFGAVGLRDVANWTRARLGALPRRQARAAGLAVLLVAAPVVAGAQVAAMDEPVADHERTTEDLRRALEPFDREFEDALVFLPRTYGAWLNHPFQPLRNGGSLESGDVLYAQDRGAAGDFAVVDAYPDRRLYRYSFRGEWDLGPSPVTPHLQSLAVREGSRHEFTTTVGVVGRPSTVRLAANGTSLVDGVSAEDGTATVEWAVNDTHATLGSGSVPLGRFEEVTLTVTFVQEGGATLTYRQEVDVATGDGRVRVLWPGERSVCRLTTDCGSAGTYVPGGDYLPGVSFETTVRTRNASGQP
ncbi:ArnT family glycosyltransferase [Halomarina litorea]|uniref:ArnT family glycosyltransferase n=1 Tax=Halomarina litorea TaxID=2961595 RepID=UPI0020C2A3F8|nr:glycosyltransferase family 39 protein [Halomarina sp. BCD28]